MANNNILFNSIKTTESNVRSSMSIPPGYIEIQLSTGGKVGAPEVFHIRNFKVQEILTLSLTSEATLPFKLIQILNDMIYEDIDVANFHEKEVEELMIYVFMNFFKAKIEDFEFPIEDEDLEALKERFNGEELIADIKSRKWIPRVTFTFASDLETYDLPENFSPEIKITNKKSKFYLVFSYVKYGDRLIVKKWLDDYFKEDERRFARFKESLKYNAELRESNDPEVLKNLIILNPEEEQAYQDFVDKKMEMLTEIIKYVSVIDYNGMDISKMSLSEKYDILSKDARIDYGMMSRLAKKENNINFGIKPEVKLLNPITGKECLRRFSFRIPTIIQAMQLFGDDDYDDEYDVETEYEPDRD